MPCTGEKIFVVFYKHTELNIDITFSDRNIKMGTKKRDYKCDT